MSPNAQFLEGLKIIWQFLIKWKKLVKRESIVVTFAYDFIKPGLLLCQLVVSTSILCVMNDRNIEFVLDTGADVSTIT